jgi:FkbM family methyltransferase
MLRSLIRRATSLRLRNDLRLRLGRHPIGLRERFPDLAAVPLERRAVVIDGGANVGAFSECVLAWQPWARLHVFEPLPEAFATLQERLARFGGVAFHRSALGAARGEADFHVNRVPQASSFLETGGELDQRLYGIDFSTTATIRVPVETVADYVRDQDLGRVDLLKLDVQGYELEVLKGAEPVLDRIAYIYCEAQFRELYRGAPLAPEIFAWLHARNFTLLRMTEFRANDAGQLIQCDMLFAANQPVSARSRRAAL